MDKIRCWHFIAEDRRLRWGIREVVEVGSTYTCEFPYEYFPGDEYFPREVYSEPTLCKAGLHGSRKIMDALNYAASSWCCLVEIWGDIQEDGDKLVGRHRHVLNMVDATGTLREFARWCALQVIYLWDAPDIVRRYLQTGDESIRAAARDAAEAAAGETAWAAAEAAAWAAAWDAAWAAARAAAWAAAWAAAEAAAWAATGAGAATRAAKREKQNIQLEQMVRKAMAV
ncbi:MAG: DUF7666 domain-containing protein [Petrotogales bacterium]